VKTGGEVEEMHFGAWMVGRKKKVATTSLVNTQEIFISKLRSGKKWLENPGWG